jgi:hypothetical protein
MLTKRLKIFSKHIGCTQEKSGFNWSRLKNLGLS